MLSSICSAWWSDAVASRKSCSGVLCFKASNSARLTPAGAASPTFAAVCEAGVGWFWATPFAGRARASASTLSVC